MDGHEASTRRARASALDVLRLGARLGLGVLKGKQADPGATVVDWTKGIVTRDNGANLDVSIPGKVIELVSDDANSRHLLAGRPGLDGYEAGALKSSGMGFLAPGALTIANGDAWLRLRPFNEEVLGTGSAHPFSQNILKHVRTAFARPVPNVEQLRAAMGRAMVNIVLGDVSADGADPAADVTSLFNVVQSPIKRKLFGFLYRGKRKRLYALLSRTWERASSDDRTLLALASRVAPDVDRDTLLQQVPHWMFTFTGSGTDLLARTLSLVTSRAGVHAKVLDEIRAAGNLDRAETIAGLHYLEACILETGRLFPPVTRTFHKPTAQGGEAREIVHYFPILQRDDRLGATVHEFRPERWLEAELDPAASASNLFLRGPRACPGMDLILFVCKAAAARQLGELGVSARQERLTRDPLPVSFPKLGQRFTVAGGTV